MLLNNCLKRLNNSQMQLNDCLNRLNDSDMSLKQSAMSLCQCLVQLNRCLPSLNDCLIRLNGFSSLSYYFEELRSKVSTLRSSNPMVLNHFLFTGLFLFNAEVFFFSAFHRAEASA